MNNMDCILPTIKVIVLGIIVWGLFLEYNGRVKEGAGEVEGGTSIDIVTRVDVRNIVGGGVIPTVSVDIDPIKVYIDEDGKIEVTHRVSGNLIVGDEAFDLDVVIEKRIERKKKRLINCMRVATSLSIDTSLALNRDFIVFYEFFIPIPFICIKAWGGLGFNGVTLAIPKYITNNAAAFIGATREWEGNTLVQLGIGVKI